jgi:RalA-binding protein 1
MTLADVLSRAGNDQVRALDELLAERNKFCLEASKLSTENMRLWNLMKRIRRENEDLKNGINVGSSAARGSPMSITSATSSSHLSGLQEGSGQSQPMAGASSLASLDSSSTLLPSSSTAPALVYPGVSGTHDPSQQVDAPMNLRAINAPVSFYESATGHSDDEPRISLSNSSEAHGPSSNQHNATATSSQQTRSLSSTTTQTVQPRSPGVSANDQLLLDSPMAAGVSDSEHSQQHASIIQQRAAAQAQRLAQLQNDRPNSIESHEFEAVDGSSAAASDGRSSARASGEVSSKQPVMTSPKVDRTNRHWSTESGRNSFSPRLDANLLQYLTAQVIGTNLRTNDRGRENVSFYISIDVDAPAGRVLRYGSWRIEKTFSDVVALDARLKQKHGKAVAKRISALTLPDQSLFKDHAPSKVDKRKAMLDKYFAALLPINMPDKDDLCTFFCTDAMPPRIYDPDALTKDGFLTKKGQNLGRWVTRWYVLSETSLDHYESRGGLHLGSINIKGAQIGRQQKSASSDSDENSYRHAFLILETKPPATPREQRQIIRHVLCAESDEDRDEWVDVLVRAIGEADVRDDRTTEETAADPNPYLSTPATDKSSNTSPAHAANPVIGAAARNQEARVTTHARQESGGSNAAHGPSVLVRSPSDNLPPTAASDARSSSISALTASPLSNMPRSRSEMVGLAVQHEERNGSLRRDVAARQGGSISAASGTALSQQQSPQQYQRQQQPSNWHAQMPGRVPVRSASQDVGSSSSAGHGMSYDSATVVRPPSPSEQIGGTAGVGYAGRPSKDRPRPSISGPMNGTPIPTGYKFGGGKEEGSSSKDSGGDTKKRFWHRFGGGGGGGGGNSGSDKANNAKKVFGVPLTDSIAVSSVCQGLELPSVVYRCLEFLESKDAASEEGIYRLSGSSAVIKGLKDRFNAQGDVNLLAPSEPYYDPHAIAGLLKQFLRELPNSVLTREMHLDFMRVNEITDRRERVNELGNLVSILPIANYTLLRTLCSHLIKVIERSDVNKMTMRNVGIVFSPTLGIPAGVFALFLTEFDWVFFTDTQGDPAPRMMDEDIIAPDDHELGLQQQQGVQNNGNEEGQQVAGPRRNKVAAHRNNRNSLSYNAAEADKLLGGPQARNRLSTYIEDFEATDMEAPVEEQADGDPEMYDERPSVDSHAAGAMHQRAIGSHDAPWSSNSHDYVNAAGGGSEQYHPAPEAEITSVYVGHSRS